MVTTSAAARDGSRRGWGECATSKSPPASISIGGHRSRCHARFSTLTGMADGEGRADGPPAAPEGEEFQRGRSGRDDRSRLTRGGARPSLPRCDLHRCTSSCCRRGKIRDCCRVGACGSCVPSGCDSIRTHVGRKHGSEDVETSRHSVCPPRTGGTSRKTLSKFRPNSERWADG